MPKKPSEARAQVGVRLSADAVALLARLQVYLGKRAGLQRRLSQSEAVEIIIREAADRANLR